MPNGGVEGNKDRINKIALGLSRVGWQKGRATGHATGPDRTLVDEVSKQIALSLLPRGVDVTVASGLGAELGDM